MKLGHFGALCLAGVTTLFIALAYWDLHLKSDSFLEILVLMPCIFGALALAMAVFPGGPLTYQQAAHDTSPDGLAIWLRQIPALHRRAWLLALVLGLYLGFWADSFLQGHDFFAPAQQIPFLVVLLIGGLLARKPLRQWWVGW